MQLHEAFGMTISRRVALPALASRGTRAIVPFPRNSRPMVWCRFLLEMRNMKLELAAVYDLAALPVVRSFVLESSRAFGASEKELARLELAAEEAAAHIISSYPFDSEDEFKITFEGVDGKLRIEFWNQGVPVDVDSLDVYRAEEPETALEGLEVFLLRRLVDEVYFLNHGSGGWSTVLEQRLEKFRTPAMTKPPDGKKLADGEKANAAREKLEVSAATPEDAQGITQLAYFTYRYTYAKTDFYYPEVLRERIEAKRIISFVARGVDSGKVVAHSAFVISEACRGVAEACSIMTHPDYRGNPGLLRLVRCQTGYRMDPANGIDLVEVNLVTTHTGSQRLTDKFGYKPTALKLSVHGRTELIGLEERACARRESLLYAVSYTDPGRWSFPVYVPREHSDMVRRIFDELGVSADIRADSAEREGDTRQRLTVRERDGFALLEFDRLGKNWFEVGRNKLKNLREEGISTAHLTFPMWEPLPENLDGILMERGFFFGGVLAETPDRWRLLYVFLEELKADFNEIKVRAPLADELKKYVEGVYEQVL